MKISNAKVIRKNSLIGSFDLELPSGLIIKGAMLLENSAKRWIGFPSKEWTDKDGQKKYFPVLDFSSKEVREKFQKQVLPLAEKELLG